MSKLLIFKWNKYRKVMNVLVCNFGPYDRKAQNHRPAQKGGLVEGGVGCGGLFLTELCTKTNSVTLKPIHTTYELKPWGFNITHNAWRIFPSGNKQKCLCTQQCSSPFRSFWPLTLHCHHPLTLHPYRLSLHDCPLRREFVCCVPHDTR